jgi:hypothetical protein
MFNLQGSGRAALLAAVLFGASALVTSVEAATCNIGGGYGDISGNVTSNSGCQIGSTNNDSVTQVNADAIGGVSGWQLIDDLELEGKSGTWNIGANFFDTYSQGLLVFKSGEGNTVPDDYVGYVILPANGTSGTWVTMFAQANDADKDKDVSHVNLYAYIGGGPAPDPTPLPGAVLLMGSVLAGSGGIAAWRRRRSQKA